MTSAYCILCKKVIVDTEKTFVCRNCKEKHARGKQINFRGEEVRV